MLVTAVKGVNGEKRIQTVYIFSMEISKSNLCKFDSRGLSLKNFIHLSYMNTAAAKRMKNGRKTNEPLGECFVNSLFAFILVLYALSSVHPQSSSDGTQLSRCAAVAFRL